MATSTSRTRAPNGVVTGPEPQRVVATFIEYGEAQAAVDLLADRRFPVEHVSIVGRDPVLVEKVVARVGYLQAAVRGAVIGGVFGALIGWVFGLFDWADPILAGFWLALWGLLLGAAWGAIAGLLMHWSTGGRRDFESIAGFRAARYDVLVDESVADQAVRILQDAATATTMGTAASARR